MISSIAHRYVDFSQTRFHVVKNTEELEEELDAVAQARAQKQQQVGAVPQISAQQKQRQDSRKDMSRKNSSDLQVHFASTGF